MRPFSHLDIAHKFWEMVVQPGDTVIDATAGNGYDSYFLATLALKCDKGSLIAFDIQKLALENTKNRLKGFPEEHIHLYEMCHSKMSQVVPPNSAKLIAFNLGYLPGGDKALTTLRESTLTAIKASLEIVLPGGLVSITCYPGHEEGSYEEEAILAFCIMLDPKKWSLSSHKFLNRPKYPHLLLLQRII